jgi:hypothetical protein
MKFILKKTTIILFILLSIVPNLYAHTPIKPSGENESFETAFNIPTPAKSWTFYRELHDEGQIEYFILHLDEGEKFVVSVYTPRNVDNDFVPNLIVLGPRIENGLPVPIEIEAPEELEITFIDGIRRESLEFEPFTPASYYFTAEYRADVTLEGDYYFLVYSDKGTGKYGIAAGYIETFTLLEWLKIPLDVIEIHQWEGQPLMLIFAPMILTLILGFIVIFQRHKPTVITLWLGILAGLLYMGSGFMTLTQMVIALNGAEHTLSFLIPLVFSILALILGSVILRKMLKLDASWTARDRIILALMGIFGLLLWAGILVGPTITLILSILPSTVLSR